MSQKSRRGKTFETRPYTIKALVLLLLAAVAIPALLWFSVYAYTTYGLGWGV